MKYGKLKINKVNYLYRIIIRKELPSKNKLKLVKLVIESKEKSWHDIIDRCFGCKQNWIKIKNKKIIIYDNDTIDLKLKDFKVTVKK